MKPRIHNFWRHLPTRKIAKVATIIVVLQTVYLLTMHNELMDLFSGDEDFPTMRPINHTFEDMDSVKYIQDLVNGKAEVAPVVEPEKYPEIYLGCSMEETRNVSRGWITNGRWFLYSAYEDRRANSLHTHDYVLIVDTDEIVVPVEEENWNDMISKFIRGFRQNATSLSARNVFKFPRKGDGVGMSGRRTRASIAQDKGVTGKSFISTQTAATVFNHFALHRLHGNVARTAYFPTSAALKLHYKTDCPTDFRDECDRLKNSSIPDHSLDRWSEEVAEQAKEFIKRVD
uniref:Glycosyltransferase family 92 protein n=1 Tax=Bursaphelenchus xylophilus TaxID=6326 RepID=A0A1I7SGA2_BURXY